MSPAGKKPGKTYWVLLVTKGPQALGEVGTDYADSGNYMNSEIAAVGYERYH